MRGMPNRHRLALCFELPAGNAPEWVELIPAPDGSGKIIGRDGRAWVFDVQAQRNVLDAYASRAVALVIDREHATQRQAANGDEAPAAAWIERLEIRAGSLWGQTEWTPRGRDQVVNREYRYISPVFDYEPSTGRVARLVSAGLTNTPNLHLTALNSEEESDMKLTAAIAAALCLAADATEEAGVSAIQKLKSDRDTAMNAERSPSLDRYVPRADYDTLLARATNAEAALTQHQVAEHSVAVDTAITGALQAGKITPATEAYHRAACQDSSGLERFRAFLTAAPAIAGASGLDGRQAGSQTTALNAEEQAVCRQLGITTEQFLANKPKE